MPRFFLRKSPPPKPIEESLVVNPLITPIINLDDRAKEISRLIASIHSLYYLARYSDALDDVKKILAIDENNISVKHYLTLLEQKLGRDLLSAEALSINSI